MLPTSDDLVDGFALYAARQRTSGACDARAVGAALREAEKLAAGHEDDEPAALFYALARRPRLFGSLHGDMLVLLAVEQSRAVGLDLTFTAIELDIHIIRVLRGEMTFVEIRGWFSARLAAIVRRPWPPLRSRPQKR
jgi:hypothetical protein